jgi:hypothetical protein
LYFVVDSTTAYDISFLGPQGSAEFQSEQGEEIFEERNFAELYDELLGF